jgi:uncharacterized heparinase superfamily protein
MNFLRKIARYYYTLKPLQISQYYYLFKYRLLQVNPPKKSYQASCKTWNRSFDFFLPKPFSLTDKWQFRFLGESGSIESDWNDQAHSKLWLYNLHYHDDLNKQGCEGHRALHYELIMKWLEKNPVMQGNGWEPYPLSLRIVNWVKWLSREQNPDSKVIESLSNQVAALNSQLEYHLRANHLFENAKALVFFGSYIDSPEASDYLQKGVKMLDEQVIEQFFDDGGHFEGSPMYHSALLWGMCDLYLLAQCSNERILKARCSQWKKVIEKGMLYLEAMSHPDGEVSFFNDSTFGIAPTFQDLSTYTDFLGLEIDLQQNSSFYPVSRHFNQSGYLVVDLSENSRAILDIANIGPDCQPGHAHADTLSFELSLFGQRLFVNSGISQYGADEERQRQRSTRLHNTVVVNGVNSSDVWGGFRVGSKAKVTLSRVVDDQECVECVASHDGYRTIKSGTVHERAWLFKDGMMEIRDRVNSSGVKPEYRLHIHPGVAIKRVNEQTLQLCFDDNQVIFQSDSYEIHLEKSAWYPGFGQKVENNVISIPFEQEELVTRIIWDKK